MRVDILTVFPDYFAPADLALLGKAQRRGIVDLAVHDLRTWTHDVHRTVDDAPYGGGPGMVMTPGPWWEALTEVTGGPPGADAGGPRSGPRPRVIVPSPSGRPFTQAVAAELAREPWLVFGCGRYEGIDGRVVDAWADDELSIGDYVLAGGEVATLVILEAVTRLLPGVVGNEASLADDSFGADGTSGLLEGRVYTRPPSFAGRDVPPELLTGNHAAVARWVRDEALRRTALVRPELLAAVALDDRDRRVLDALGAPAPEADRSG
jgi:tRNA (guanine37-N1)-methyltransferase